MVRYRRNFVPGGTFFFTITLRDRSSRVLVDHIDALRAAVRAAQARRPFDIDAMVVMPDHIHMVVTLPLGDTNYSNRLRFIKSRFTRAAAAGGVALNRNARGEYDLWQRRFWEHTIRDELDMEQHINYVHINPVKHGYVTRAVDWPHSSIHRYIKAGWLTPDWGVNITDSETPFGEP